MCIHRDKERKTIFIQHTCDEVPCLWLFQHCSRLKKSGPFVMQLDVSGCILFRSWQAASRLNLRRPRPRGSSPCRSKLAVSVAAYHYLSTVPPVTNMSLWFAFAESPHSVHSFDCKRSPQVTQRHACGFDGSSSKDLNRERQKRDPNIKCGQGPRWRGHGDLESCETKKYK